jgi:acyl-CoA synthetase (NDP forming)
MIDILNKSKKFGWVLEPDAKKLLSNYALHSPDYIFAKNCDESILFAENTGFPVVCKVVSPDIIHKSDVGGVIVGIKNHTELKSAFEKLIKLKGALGVLVEKMVKGVELIVGAKNDTQFGPVILIGMGGVGVEIYKDVAIRMVPLKERDVDEMLSSLQCFPLLKGYRGEKGINLEKFKDMILNFSKFTMDIKDHFESIDLNPVICSDENCFVADARIML